MATLYVARSQGLSKWGGEVGLTKHIFKVGLAKDSPDSAIKALNAATHAGQADWKLIAKEQIDDLAESDIIARIATKEKMVDPNYYPRLQGAKGIFKVKIENAEAHMLMKRAMEGAESLAAKTTPADIGAYLIKSALR
ncbi:MAG: hypothetical protein U1E97_10465 [Alphaproteobacteria bacterium]